VAITRLRACGDRPGPGGGAGTSNCAYAPNVHGSIGFALPGLEARIATRDDEGHYFIVDRRKDLIITGGFNVYPAGIERVVASTGKVTRRELKTLDA
jgi:hypothetical protein